MKVFKPLQYRHPSVMFPSPKGGGPIEGVILLPLGIALKAGFHRRKAVAPLKGTFRLGCDRRYSRFHRRKAVAPLKVRHRCPPPRQLRCFHRRKAVAPLKVGLTAPRRCTAPTRFHRRKAVAPLKAVLLEHLDTGRVAFPSPKGGGPIEGRELLVVTELNQRFPSPKGGGPIEGTAPSTIPPNDWPVSIAERRWPH